MSFPLHPIPMTLLDAFYIQLQSLLVDCNSINTNYLSPTLTNCREIGVNRLSRRGPSIRASTVLKIDKQRPPIAINCSYFFRKYRVRVTQRNTIVPWINWVIATARDPGPNKANIYLPPSRLISPNNMHCQIKFTNLPAWYEFTKRMTIVRQGRAPMNSSADGSVYFHSTVCIKSSSWVRRLPNSLTNKSNTEMHFCLNRMLCGFN